MFYKTVRSFCFYGNAFTALHKETDFDWAINKLISFDLNYPIMALVQHFSCWIGNFHLSFFFVFQHCLAFQEHLSINCHYISKWGLCSGEMQSVLCSKKHFICRPKSYILLLPGQRMFFSTSPMANGMGCVLVHHAKILQGILSFQLN